MKKSLSFLLALLLLTSSLAACSETTSDETTGTQDTSPAAEETLPAEETETEAETLPLGLAENLGYDGYEMRVLTYNAEKGDSFITELTGDSVNDALYGRDREVEELLEIVLKPISYNELGLDATMLQTSVTAGDDLYDFMHLQGSTFFANRPTLEKILVDVSESPNLSLESPWWNTDATRELSYNGKSIKYLIGDISTTSISGASVIFYNKQLFNNIYHDGDMPYTDVLEGKWTIDKFSEYCAGAYQDVNGNGTADKDDFWGAMTNYWMFQSLYNGFSDTRFYTRDENGYVKLDIDMERAVTYSEKLYSLLWENSGFMYIDEGQWHDSAVLEFSQNKTLFVSHFLRYVETDEMRNMEADYGILPFFKLDESQAEYRSDLNPSYARWICIPVTCSDVDRSTAVIEALSYYSFYDVTPIFYEEALKSKYVRDTQSGQVIDMVRDSIKTDYLIGIYRSTIGQHFVNMILGQDQEYISNWERSERSYTKLMDKTFEDLDS